MKCPTATRCACSDGYLGEDDVNYRPKVLVGR